MNPIDNNTTFKPLPQHVLADLTDEESSDFLFEDQPMEGFDSMSEDSEDSVIHYDLIVPPRDSNPIKSVFSAPSFGCDEFQTLQTTPQTEPKRRTQTIFSRLNDLPTTQFTFTLPFVDSNL
ncbi:hypothetical protein EIN_405980 [Entamoeba invadens IP1]|uniref:Uncharacterized protein n=1 Tax=Entamoeba invadens IP1 TaxID=370355 RepID=A0A0A1UCX3_ENTIV|nr:hypothetical protein EIN_405980 [Entamoeba invadens IP1]ELP90144.1 hypothetical protein EIN_405980 [Entamoeba invadens IP1]|eukprot:XP_004256915.1 hypothetical protein EIN_405980 [Entamoeba invadens IP1]